MDIEKLEKKILNKVDLEKEKAYNLNEYIYRNPETAYKEYKADEKYVELLKKEGIEVEEKYLGLDTAFKATITEDDNSDIKIGILAEYDALPKIGHACGHSASGALSFLAALGLNRNKDNLKGNIYLIGTPAEEFNGAKSDLANSGEFDDYSFVIMIHMLDKNNIYSKFQALDGYNFEFIGKPSHAAASPWEGRNAVNGMTLFMNALDMMRQQTKDGTRIHGMITEGGSSANTIPDYASCIYMFRYKEMTYLKEIIDWVKEAAEGCAKATQTIVKISSPGRPLADLKPTPSTDKLIKEIYEELDVKANKEEIEPLGSSDIGNLSYKCPAFHPTISISNEEVSPHTEEFAKCMLTEKTKWAIEKGAKAISALVVRTLYDESIIKNMKKDFKESK